MHALGRLGARMAAHRDAYAATPQVRPASATRLDRRWTAGAPLALEGPAIEWRVRLLQPIDRDVAAIDPMGARRGQKDDDVGYLLGRAEPVYRKAVPHVIVEIVRRGDPVAIPTVAGDQDRSRRDGIDAHPMGHEFERPALGIEDQ